MSKAAQGALDRLLDAKDSRWAMAKTPGSAFELGDWLFFGLAERKIDRNEAKLTWAADESSPACLGRVYSYGIGVRKDSEKAFKCFQEAASREGDDYQVVGSRCLLGVSYLFGLGCEANPKRGFRLIYNSSLKGHPLSFHILAKIYNTGVEGVVKADHAEFLRYLHLAVDHRVADAEYDMAVHVGKDHPDFEMWLARAVAQDHPDARALSQTSSAPRKQFSYYKVENEYEHDEPLKKESFEDFGVYRDQNEDIERPEKLFIGKPIPEIYQPWQHHFNERQEEVQSPYLYRSRTVDGGLDSVAGSDQRREAHATYMYGTRYGEQPSARRHLAGFYGGAPPFPKGMAMGDDVRVRDGEVHDVKAWPRSRIDRPGHYTFGVTGGAEAEAAQRARAAEKIERERKARLDQAAEQAANAARAAKAAEEAARRAAAKRAKESARYAKQANASAQYAGVPPPPPRQDAKGTRESAQHRRETEDSAKRAKESGERARAQRDAERERKERSQAVWEGELKKVFARTDKNQDGFLTRAEIIKAVKTDIKLRALLELSDHVSQADDTQRQFERAFQSMDENTDRSVTYEEFRKFATQVHPKFDERVALLERTRSAGQRGPLL